jgi:hypothetical protein
MCAVVEKRKLDRRLNSRGRALTFHGQGFRATGQDPVIIISILRGGEAHRGKDALQVTVAQQLSLFGSCLLWRGNAKLCLL